MATIVTHKDIRWDGQRCVVCQQPLGADHKDDCELVQFRSGEINTVPEGRP